MYYVYDDVDVHTYDACIRMRACPYKWSKILVLKIEIKWKKEEEEKVMDKEEQDVYRSGCVESRMNVSRSCFTAASRSISLSDGWQRVDMIVALSSSFSISLSHSLSPHVCLPLP